MTEKIKIQYRELSELTPDARNARTHTSKQIDSIAASIREFGWTVPILVDAKGAIIAGHARFQAATRLGMKSVPTIELSNLTKAQHRAYMLADNKLALDAGWDDEILGQELEELMDLGFDMALTGFGQEEIDLLLAEQGEDETPEEKNLSKVDALLKEPENKVERGDVWRMGDHMLYCMDVVTQHSEWAGELKSGDLLCVYAGPFVALSKKAQDARLIIVQPDPYVAGHILDSFQKVSKGKPKKIK
jgi:hypothetical protein